MLLECLQSCRGTGYCKYSRGRANGLAFVAKHNQVLEVGSAYRNTDASLPHADLVLLVRQRAQILEPADHTVDRVHDPEARTRVIRVMNVERSLSYVFRGDTDNGM